MAARKKSGKKKSNKKKLAKKKPAVKSKKTAKKKSASKAKGLSKKTTKTKKVSVRKAPAKKKPIKKTKSIGFAVSRGPSIEAIEAVIPLDLDALFELGIGHIDVNLIRKGNIIETKTLNQTGQISFEDVRQKDRLDISGTATGSAAITTNRTTDPPSDDANPRRFKDEPILALLKVL